MNVTTKIAHQLDLHEAFTMTLPGGTKVSYGKDAENHLSGGYFDPVGGFISFPFVTSGHSNAKPLPKIDEILMFTFGSDSFTTDEDFKAMLSVSSSFSIDGV